MNESTRAERQRHVRAAAFVINEELRLKLIDSKTAIKKLYDVHAAAGFPFSENKTRRTA